MLKAGESQMATGLVVMALSAAMWQFAFVGGITFLLLPVAIVLVVNSVMTMQLAASVSAWRRLECVLILIMGSLLLSRLALLASSMAFAEHTGSAPSQIPHWNPTSVHWVQLGLAALAPAILIAWAIQVRTAWPRNRCALWGALVWCVCPVTAFITWATYPFMPISL
jgi:hypothetical protein